jgi:beta-mannosidase
MTFYNCIDPNTNKLTRKIIPEALNSYDPFRTYIPSSPYISPTSYKLNNDSKLPEAHLWGPRDNFKSSFYMQDGSNFISEIGYHGCPSVSSIKKFIDEDHLWPQFDNDQWTVHCTAPDKDIKNSIYAYRVELMTNQIRELFGDVPTDMQEFVIASQISQAEAKKFFIEFTRQKKWKRSGIIWWNALDGWPQFSDAVIDYYFNRKLAVHYIRRSQEPVQLIMCEPFNWSSRLIVSNDSNMTFKGKYYVMDADDDSVVSQGEFSCEKNQNKHLANIPVSNGVHKMFLLKIELENGKVIANHYLHGHSPFSFDKYKKYLEKIAQLDGNFDCTKIGV